MSPDNKPMECRQPRIWNPVAMVVMSAGVAAVDASMTSSAKTAAPLVGRFTNFFIDEILRPDFGCRARALSSPTGGAPGAAGRRSVEEPVPAHIAPEVTSTTTTAVDERLQPGTAEPAGDNGGKNALWPAWVYCTRYSDRPSSGRYPDGEVLRAQVQKPIVNFDHLGKKACSLQQTLVLFNQCHY